MTADTPFVLAETLSVQIEPDVSRARLALLSHARRLEMPTVQTYRLATALTELCSNLVFHATSGGLIHLQTHRSPQRSWIDLIVVDEGPGIADLSLAMRDGYSTNGGLGGGLPGSRRLVDDFFITSHPGAGTLVKTRLWR